MKLVTTEFAQYPPETLLDQEALAQVLGVSTRTIRRMVDRDELPPGIALGRKRAWLAGKVRDFLSARAEDLHRRYSKRANGERTAL
jgi:predicted DNA-binding transcriptional regulator AlpA